MIYIFAFFLFSLFTIILFSLIFYKQGTRAFKIVIPAIIVIFLMIYLEESGSISSSLNGFISFVFKPFLVGTCIGLVLKYKKSLQFFVLITSFTITVVFSLNHYYNFYQNNIDPLSDSKKNTITFIKSSPMSLEDKEKAVGKVNTVIDFLQDKIPFIYYTDSLLFIFISFSLLKLILRKYMKLDIDESYDIELFKLNDYLIFSLISGLLLFLLVDKTNNLLFYTLGLNCALILLSLYLIQGFGIVKCFISTRKIPAFLLPLSFLVMIILGLELFLLFLSIFTFIGITDLWIDYRKKIASNNKHV